jgi:hypothetical protein
MKFETCVHEAGHTVVAVLVGAEMRSVTVAPAETNTFGSPSQRLRIALAGVMAEELLCPDLADARLSLADYQEAFTMAQLVAQVEAHDAARLATMAAGRPSKSAKLRNIPTQPEAAKLHALEKLSTRTAAERAEALERLTAGWAARAHVLVAEAEREVRELLACNRVACVVVAKALHEHGSLDADAVRGLLLGVERAFR